VHRDIKPENVMLRPDGYVKVLDFGVAARIGTDEDLAAIPIGTLGYMSPEQIEGKPLTGASDVFSLGVVLTELASGRHPFLQDTALLTSKAIKTAGPGWLTDVESKTAEPLGSLLRSLLAREPEQRPSAAMVAARLDSIARGPAAGAWTRWTAAAVLVLIVSGALVLWRATAINVVDSSAAEWSTFTVTKQRDLTPGGSYAPILRPLRRRCRRRVRTDMHIDAGRRPVVEISERRRPAEG